MLSKLTLVASKLLDWRFRRGNRLKKKVTGSLKCSPNLSKRDKTFSVTCNKTPRLQASFTLSCSEFISVLLCSDADFSTYNTENNNKAVSRQAEASRVRNIDKHRHLLFLSALSAPALL